MWHQNFSSALLAIILLRTLQVFHFQALLHEKAVLRKILLIESFVFHWPDHLKGVVIKLAGWRLIFKRGHFENYTKRRGTLDLQYIDQPGCRLDGRPLQCHHRRRQILPSRKRTYDRVHARSSRRRI